MYLCHPFSIPCNPLPAGFVPSFEKFTRRIPKSEKCIFGPVFSVIAALSRRVSQILDDEIRDHIEEMPSRVSTKNSVVAIWIKHHAELLVGLLQFIH